MSVESTCKVKRGYEEHLRRKRSHQLMRPESGELNGIDTLVSPRQTTSVKGSFPGFSAAVNELEAPAWGVLTAAAGNLEIPDGARTSVS